MKKIILLSGTPASGKDTISQHLTRIDDKFVLLKKHKTGTGGKLDNSYILIEHSKFESMIEKSEFIQYHYRYNRGYGVSIKELNKIFDSCKVPIIHVGKYENLKPFKELEGVEVVSILLVVSKNETIKRLNARHLDDAEEIESRVNAYIEERAEIASLISSCNSLNFDFMINNDNKSASDIARKIHKISEE